MAILPICTIRNIVLYIIQCAFTFQFILCSVQSESSTKWHHSSQILEDNSIQKISEIIQRRHADFNATLDSLLIERVPGTAGNRQVRQFITNSMQSLGWHVEEDAFMAETPHGTKPFSNVIATLDPRACRRLVLACHHDSKYFSDGVFLAATDSAVPCSMMIHLAQSLNASLHEHTQLSRDLTLQFLFFDGEEAFVTWSKTDSLYGSRHLAEKWNRTPYSQESCGTKTNMLSELDRIDALVLLDLLGTADPKFKSFFPDTSSLFENLVSIEQRLSSSGLLESYPPEKRAKYFYPKPAFTFIEDDHVPFMKKGVPILHIIPVPFPSVWHTLADNRENLHHPTINNLNKIFHTFVAEYLHLNVC